MLYHLSPTSLDNLERIEPILKQRMQQIDAPPTTLLIPQSSPANPLGRVPHAPTQRQNTPIVFPHLAPATATPPPRVTLPPRVVPPLRVDSPPRVGAVATPRHSPRLKAQEHTIPPENDNDTPANNDRSRSQFHSITQQTMLAYANIF